MAVEVPHIGARRIAAPAGHLEPEIEMDGLKAVVDIYAEQTNLKGPPPNPEKYVDQIYLRQALKELGLIR